MQQTERTLTALADASVTDRMRALGFVFVDPLEEEDVRIDPAWEQRFLLFLRSLSVSDT